MPKAVKMTFGLMAGFILGALFLYCMAKKINIWNAMMISGTMVLIMFSFYYSFKMDTAGTTFIGYSCMMIAWMYWYANIRQGGPIKANVVGLIFVFIPVSIAYIIMKARQEFQAKKKNNRIYKEGM